MTVSARDSFTVLILFRFVLGFFFFFGKERIRMCRQSRGVRKSGRFHSLFCIIRWARSGTGCTGIFLSVSVTLASPYVDPVPYQEIERGGGEPQALKL